MATKGPWAEGMTLMIITDSDGDLVYKDGDHAREWYWVIADDDRKLTGWPLLSYKGSEYRPLPLNWIFV